MKLSSKHSVLLKSTLVLYTLFFCLYFLTSFTFKTEVLYNDLIEFNLFTELLLLALIAPVIEEFIFRAPLIIKNKKWPILLFIVCLGYLIFSLPRFDLRVLTLFIWSSVLIFSKFFVSTKTQEILIWISILSFAVSHLSMDSFLSLDSFILFIFFLASGCLLTWVILNFGLFKSILFHSAYNLISFSIYLLTLTYFFDDKAKTNCLDNTCIEWKQNALLESPMSDLNYTNHKLDVKNGKVKNILDLLSNLDLKNYNYIISDDSKIKYDIKIYNTNNEEINDSLILESLNSSGLIKILKKE
ncbi:MAG TPA: CPBP family glutamic-type intramembrane protease [Flavobacteriaceae bacterium]|nr:CPBP family glutamic-type intramembrane protease [Flavobacteriaceae bacterium]